jgi:N-acetylneuraminic acid mutarotase
MGCKFFLPVLMILISISTLTACVATTEEVTVPSQTITAAPATHTQPAVTMTPLSPTLTSTPVPHTSTVTVTSTPKPSVTPVIFSCDGAPNITLKLDIWAQVSSDPPLPNRLRKQPGMSGEIIGQVQPGGEVLVVDGPVCADDYTWWLVRSSDGLEGWSAEGNSKGYWFIPLQQSAEGWQPQAFTSFPSPRKGIAMVYDLARKVVVVVGGTDWKMVSGETWEFDGVSWKFRSDVNRIPERSGASVAYDKDRQVTVLFGGNGLGNSKFFNDTWEYDGTKWVKQNPSISPPSRNGAAMAYDPQGQRLLLFGGFGRVGDPPFFDDTWEYKNGEWRQLAPSQHPSAREATQMVYDSARDRMVLFGGGQNAGSVVYNETWEWNGENWMLRTDLPTSPPARWAYLMAYDEGCHHVVLFGGLTGAYSMFGDTWTYDGKTWTQVKNDLQPPARWDGGLVYDPNYHRLILFGGQYWLGDFIFLADVWYFTEKCD